MPEQPTHTFFNSRCAEYKTPFGAVPAGQTVTWRLTVPERLGYVDPHLVLTKDREDPVHYRMDFDGQTPGVNHFVFQLAPTTSGLYFYHFDLYTDFRKIYRTANGEGELTWVNGLDWQLTVYEPDFKTPWAVREAGIESLEHGRTRYTSNAGLKELRAEIARYLDRRMGLKYDPAKEVLVTVGGSEAIDMCIRTLVQPGDEVIIPEPCFVCYEPITTLSGGVPVHVACHQEDEFRLRADALKAAITPRTKLLIMPFPNNPTGAVMERADLEAIAEVLRGTDITVLSDEIYAELNYGLQNHVSIATLPGMAERTVVVNGFSKTYAMTGWRLGYACGPAPIIKIMTKIHQSAIMSAPTTSQYAAITALKDCDGEIERMRNEYNMRRRLVVKSFNDMGLSCFEPRGAFYAFPCIKSSGMSSEEFCTKLLEQKHVAIIPGNAFGASGEGYARVSYAYSVEHLMEAIRRIREFLNENCK
mgnify:CR=1 FL=1